jgi:hypothetical protein
LGNDFAHHACQFWTRSAGPAKAGTVYLLRCYARCSTSLPYSGLQRLSRCRLADANDVTCTGRRCDEQRSFIPDRTRRLSPTAVNPEIVKHGSFLTYVVAGLQPWDYKDSLAERRKSSDNESPSR